MNRLGGAALALVLLAGCKESAPAQEVRFHIAETNFTYDLPQGFCEASQDWKRSFEPIAVQNPDKAILAQLVDCVENARYANSPNYILVSTYSDTARQKIDRAGLMKDFKPNMDPKQFAALLHSGKTFKDLEAAVAASPEKPLGEDGYLFPEVNDEYCIYSGGRYGQPPLTPENSGTVINCIASIGGYQLLIMYNGDGKQDLLVMARKVSALVRSLKALEK